MSTANSCLHDGQVTAAWLVPFLVDPAVQVLQEGQVRGEHVLDDAGVDVRAACRGG